MSCRISYIHRLTGTRAPLRHHSWNRSQQAKPPVTALTSTVLINSGPTGSPTLPNGRVCLGSALPEGAEHSWNVTFPVDRRLGCWTPPCPGRRYRTQPRPTPNLKSPREPSGGWQRCRRVSPTPPPRTRRATSSPAPRPPPPDPPLPSCSATRPPPSHRSSLPRP